MNAGPGVRVVRSARRHLSGVAPGRIDESRSGPHLISTRTAWLCPKLPPKRAASTTAELRPSRPLKLFSRWTGRGPARENTNRHKDFEYCDSDIENAICIWAAFVRGRFGGRRSGLRGWRHVWE